MAELTVGYFKYLGGNLSNSDTKECGYGYTDGSGDPWTESGMFLNMTTSSKLYGWQIRSNLRGSSIRIRCLYSGQWGDWMQL